MVSLCQLEQQGFLLSTGLGTISDYNYAVYQALSTRMESREERADVKVIEMRSN